MLSGLRNAYHNSLVVKILFGVLTLPFIAWGIGDVWGSLSSRTPPALSVGDVKYAAADVAAEFRRDEQQLQQQMGSQKLTDQMAVQLGLLDQTIQRMVSGSLLDQEAAKLGMVIDNGTLHDSIAQIPAFHDPTTDKFDLRTYQAALQGANMTEPQFLELQRAAMLRSDLVTAVTGGIGPPPAMLDPLFAYQGERRTAELILVPASAMPKPAAPDDAILRAYYKGHQDAFTTPELRQLTAIVLTPDLLSAAIKPSEDEIKAAYEQHQSDFGTAEQRQVSQVLFSDEKSADAFIAAVRGGKDFNAAAQAAGVAPIDLGTVERGGLPLAALSDAVFGATAPGVVGPVKTDLGWHVLDVVKIVPAAIAPLAQVRDRVVAALVASQAQDKLTDIGNKIDDALGANASLEEAAGKGGVTPVKIAATDESGKDADGKPAAGVPESTAFLQAAFQQATGTTGGELDAMEDDKGYFVIRVDKVTPPALKPYDQVKDAVLADWTAAQQQDEATKAADGVAQRLKAGEPLATVAGSFRSMTSDPFPRTGDEKMPALVAANLFALKVGDTTTVPGPGGVFVARLASVIPADHTRQAEEYQQAGTALAQAMAQDVAAAYVGALQRQFGVSVNQDAIKAQLSAQ